MLLQKDLQNNLDVNLKNYLILMNKYIKVDAI